MKPMLLYQKNPDIYKDLPSEIIAMPKLDGIRCLITNKGPVSRTLKLAVDRGALQTQVGGDHYKRFRIQPIEFCYANGIPFAEGNAIKYICRWRFKDGIKDLEKAKHILEMLIEMAKKDAPHV